MMKGLRIALIVLAAVIAVSAAYATWWGMTPLGPTDSALLALESDALVVVSETSAGFEFSPASQEPSSALVLYPGGHVDARSYAPLAREIAAAGYLVVVPPMPLSLAVLAPNAANKAVEAHPEVDAWVIGGHSLGGTMAAQYASRNAETAQGLLLLAAYPAGSSDLSDQSLAVADVVATSDGVLTWENWEEARALLPASTKVVRIEGGNHAQFGDYGPQPGDNEATISAEEQRAQAAASALELLERASTDAP
jgi:dienelactone hydrolase